MGVDNIVNNGKIRTDDGDSLRYVIEGFIMGVVTIEVNDSELVKLKNFKIIETDIELKRFLRDRGDIGELSEYEFSEVFGCCLSAILTKKLGITYNIELGRSPQNDRRTYTLMSVNVTDNPDDVEILVADALVYMSTYVI